MFMNTIWTHVTVGLMVIGLCTVSYLAYGNLIQDIVLYNLPTHSNLARLIELMYMLNIVGSFTICIQPIYAILEKEDFKKERTERTSEPEDSHILDRSLEGQYEGMDYMWYIKRLATPAVIMLTSTLFPDVNTLLSLVAGSICGVLLIVLPVFFYRAAYIDKPSKKNRTFTVAAGYLLVTLTLPLGMIGVYTNIKHMMAAPE